MIKRASIVWANMSSKLNYKHKIMCIILAFIFVPFCLFGQLYATKMWHSKVDNLLDENKNTIKSSVEIINNTLYENVKKIAYISCNRRLNEILTLDNEIPLIEYMDKYELINDLMVALELNNKKSNILIYTFNEMVYEGAYFRKSQRLDPILLQEILNKNNEFIWKFKKSINDDEDTYLYLYKLVSSVEHPLYIVEIRIPFKLVTEPLNIELPQNSFIAYITDSGEYEVTGSNNTKIDEADRIILEYLKNHKSSNYFTIEMDLKVNSHKVVLFIHNNTVNSGLPTFILLVLLAALLISFIIYLLAEIVSGILTKRLSRLIKKIDNDVESIINNNNVESIDLDGNDEFSRIGDKFNQLVLRIKEYYHKASQYEIELLQARLNRHFLYNTLSAIKWAYPDPRLTTVIDAMVKYYRIALNKGNNVFIISEEIEMIKQYIMIQTFAYRLEYTCIVDLEEGVGECLILKNLLQPIVENAIIHGINGKKSNGIVSIKGKLKNGIITLNIKDDGIGMNEEKLKNLIEGKNENMFGGYGMKNVRERIQTYYGSEYGLSIKSAVNQGTTVTITIPAVRETKTA